MYPIFKNIFDRSIAALLLLVAGIPCISIGLINSLIDREPVLFSQARIGIAGKTFRLFKIRTMKTGEVTRLGRFLRRWSIDEIPQLWNVIRGNMSIIGPRPLLVEYREFYSDRQNRRHEVLPGITGLSQVNGRNSLDWEKRFELDVHYVEHQSFWLDLKILVKTCHQLTDRRSADHHYSELPKFSEQHSYSTSLFLMNEPLPAPLKRPGGRNNSTLKLRKK